MLSGLKATIQELRSHIPASVRYGAPYRRQLKYLLESQFFDPDRMREHQCAGLRTLLRQAFTHSPYFRELSKKLGCTFEDFRSAEDLRQLPVLSRESVRDRQAEILCGNIPESRRLRRFTGGTGGQPLGFVVERGRTDPLERAFVARVWNWFGSRFEDSAVIFRGYAVDPSDIRRGRFWQPWYPERNWACFSSYHMTEQNLPAYAAQLRQLDPIFISCVASDLDPLARHWIEAKLPPLPRLRFIHQSGMVMHPEQRRRFERAFGARAFSTYGQSECTVFASECEHSAVYHVFPEYGVTEILRRDGTPTDVGEVGEIVATGFNNHAMPLIRYRTGDLGAWSGRGCECGRSFPLLSRLEGRGQYMIVLSDGTLVGLNSILYGSHLPGLEQIKQVQVVQEKAGEIILVVVPMPGFDDESGGALAAGLQSVVEGRLEVRIRIVPEIPRVEGEKFKILVQKLPVSWWASHGGEGQP